MDYGRKLITVTALVSVPGDVFFFSSVGCAQKLFADSSCILCRMTAPLFDRDLPSGKPTEANNTIPSASAEDK